MADILFDIGASNTRMAVANASGDIFSTPKIFPTPALFADAMALFGKVAREISGGDVTRAVGGVAGPMNKDRTKLIDSHVRDWIGKPLKESLEVAFGAPVHLGNDSSLVGLGEACFGAGRGHSLVVYITVSTGIGGARIVDGKIDRNSFGFEPGHQIICVGGEKCATCGTAGHLEAYVSGSAFKKKYFKDAQNITDPFIWEEAAQWLAYGLHNVIMLWSPDIIVLGGKMITGNPRIEIGRVREHLADTLTFLDGMPEIRRAELGDVGGLFGALELLKEKNS